MEATFTMTAAEWGATVRAAAARVTADPAQMELVLRDAMSAYLASRGHSDDSRILREWHKCPAYWH
jgi:hypothetical protein